MDLEFFTSTLEGSALFVLGTALITGVLFECANRRLMHIVSRQPWWPNARPLQGALFKNFGYPEQDLSEEVLLDGFAYVLLGCGHHVLAGLMTVPVVFFGWGDARPLQLIFLFGALADVALDVYDVFKKCVQKFVPKLSSKLFTGTCPLAFFVVICCLHHPLAMLMVVPMNLYYPHLEPYHQIVCALLLAAGVCFLSGQYKFTLNTKTLSGFYQFKGIVLLQLVTILFTRGFIWFTRAWACLAYFYRMNDMRFFAGGCICAGLMSMFNVVMIMDSLGAAVKWLPRSKPEHEEDHEELKEDIVKLVRSITPSSGLSQPLEVREDMVKLVRSITPSSGLLQPLQVGEDIVKLVRSITPNSGLLQPWSDCPDKKEQ